MAFESLSERLSQVFKKLRGKGKLSENDIRTAMREVRIALLEADVNYKVVKDFVENLTQRSIGSEVLDSLTPAQQVVKIVNEELTVLMGSENEYIRLKSTPPTVLMMVGLQGAGKTTHAAKLAKFFAKQGHRPLLVACDIYRPAAIDQLQTLGKNINIPVFTSEGMSPEKIASQALRHAKDHGNDIVIVDTAGRLHIDADLMGELKRVKEQASVDETLLVIDAMVGQDAVNVAKTFNDDVGIDGVVLTKLDGDTRGGAALSVRAVTGKPIKFVGVGEKLDDLEAFHPERMAGRILGMGDMLTLIEKAQSTVDQKETENMAKRMMSNKFDMNDMLTQLEQIKKMGGLSAMMGMMPDMGKMDTGSVDDKMFVSVEAIILSMTPAERARPSIINPKRKRRIAQGSGTQVQDVNKLLKMHEQTAKTMKQIKKNPKRFSRMGGGRF